MKNLKTFESFNESNEQEFEERPAYVDSGGALIGHKSTNGESASKLAFEELKELGVPVAEPRSHDNDPTVLFIIDAEEEDSEKWVNPFYGSEIAKLEGWKNPKVSNIVIDILTKYKLYPDFADGATVEIRTFSR